MLCSAHDIGWSDKADGILVVMPNDAQPGDPCPADPPKVNTHVCRFVSSNYLFGLVCEVLMLGLVRIAKRLARATSIASETLLLDVLSIKYRVL